MHSFQQELMQKIIWANKIGVAYDCKMSRLFINFNRLLIIKRGISRSNFFSTLKTTSVFSSNQTLVSTENERCAF